MTARIETDLTSLHRGLARARWENASEPVFPGDVVIAVDSDEQLAADAVVVEMQGYFAYLEIDWSTQRDDEGPEDWERPGSQMLPNSRYLSFSSLVEPVPVRPGRHIVSA